MVSEFFEGFATICEVCYQDRLLFQPGIFAYCFDSLQLSPVKVQLLKLQVPGRAWKMLVNHTESAVSRARFVRRGFLPVDIAPSGHLCATLLIQKQIDSSTYGAAKNQQIGLNRLKFILLLRHKGNMQNSMDNQERRN